MTPARPSSCPLSSPDRRNHTTRGTPAAAANKYNPVTYPNLTDPLVQ